ncbi:MAG: hypothetical protein LBC85_00905 [Fibromonadaceae bacterium]|jgi:hypothetical protein|nr:hypothetical protein [Fibromonadaceae bacterium]
MNNTLKYCFTGLSIVILFCASPVFAAWDYFPLRGLNKGQAKIDYETGSKTTLAGVRYEPIKNLEFAVTSLADYTSDNYAIGFRWQLPWVEMLRIYSDFSPAHRLSGNNGPMSLYSGIQFSHDFNSLFDSSIDLGWGNQIGIAIADDTDFNCGTQLELYITAENAFWLSVDFSTKGLATETKDYGLIPAFGYFACGKEFSVCVGTYLKRYKYYKSDIKDFDWVAGIDVSFLF